MRLNAWGGTVGAPERFRRQLGIVVTAGALVRLVYLATKWNRPLRLNDSVWYSAMADGLRHGRFFHHLVTDGPSAEHPPLASLLMAPGSFLPDAVQGQRLTSAVAGVVAVALIGLLGRRVGGPLVGLVAAALAAVYPNLWLNDGLVMSESFAVAFVAAALLALHMLLQRPGLRQAALAGALLGLCALTRSELVLLTPLAAVLVLAHGRQRAAAFRGAVLAVAAVAVMLPWMAVNLARFERPVLLTTNDGTTLLGSYCDDIFGGANKGGWSVFCVFDAPDPGGDDSVRSAAQRSLAVRYARDHVRELPGVVVARVARAVDLYGLADMVHGDVGEEKPRAAVWAGIVAWWLLAPLAALGLTRLRRRDRWLLALPLLVTATATIVFYGGHRLRSPSEPVVVVLAALAACHLCNLWQHRARWATTAAATADQDGSADGGGDHVGDAVGTDVGELAGG